MTDLRILPDEPWAAPRERYRVLASQERLPSPLEFDARPKPRMVWVPALAGLVLLAIAIASVFALCAWMIPNG